MLKPLFAYLVYAPFFLSLISSIAFGGPQTSTADSLVEVIRDDWRLREAPENEWGAGFETRPESLLTSRCHQKDLENYDLEKGPLSARLHDVTAIYCPKEKRYWIYERGGDKGDKLVWSGPFALDTRKLKR